MSTLATLGVHVDEFGIVFSSDLLTSANFRFTESAITDAKKVLTHSHLSCGWLPLSDSDSYSVGLLCQAVLSRARKISEEKAKESVSY